MDRSHLYIVGVAAVLFVCMALIWQETESTPRQAGPHVRNHSITSPSNPPGRLSTKSTPGDLREKGSLVGSTSPPYLTESFSGAADKEENTDDSLLSAKVAESGFRSSAERNAEWTTERAIDPDYQSPTPLPLVFQVDDPAMVPLSPAQHATVERLRTDFSGEIASLQELPDSPAYAKRWRSAQPLSDLRLRAMIGNEAFARYQYEAYIRAKN